MDLQTQEYFGWIGNAIFVSAQLFQIVHTHKIKTTRDISYGLQILFFIGDLMFTIFGAVDKSLSMFFGNGVVPFLYDTNRDKKYITISTTMSISLKEVIQESS